MHMNDYLHMIRRQTNNKLYC